MMNDTDLLKAIRLMNAGSYSFVLCKDNCTLVSKEQGIKALLHWVSQRSEPAVNGERSHRASGLALAGCRGNAKMDGRREAGKACDSHRRR